MDHDGGERGRYAGPVLERSVAPGLTGRRGLDALGAVSLGLALVAGVRALRGGRSGGDVAPSLGGPDYGASRYADDEFAVADSAEGAMFTPGVSAGTESGWRPGEGGGPSGDGLASGSAPPQAP
jgi:hypothetical protein